MGYDLTESAERVGRFSADRDWGKFHSLKNLAMALTGEVGELVEIIQWLGDDEIRELMNTREGRVRVEEEVADIVIYLLRIAQQTDIDLSDAIGKKLDINDSRYPVDIAKGSSAKYKKI